VLSTREAYPAFNWGGPPGGDGSPLHWVISTRGLGQLREVIAECASDFEYYNDDGVACNEAWEWYIWDLLWPFGLPFLLGLLSMLCHWTCCFVACCRICRRKVICCGENGEAREAPRWKVAAAVVFWAACSIGIFGLGVTMNEVSVTLNYSIQWHLCTALTLAAESTGGSPGMYLGSELAVSYLSDISAELDVDGQVMTTVRRVIRETQNFTDLQEDFRMRVNHFEAVLNKTGPAYRVFEHRCVFCSLGVGDPIKPTPGFPAEGLLPALRSSVEASASEAIGEIRGIAMQRFLEQNLTSMSRDVKVALGAARAFDDALFDSLVRYWPRFVHSADTIEPARLAAFIILGWCAMSGAVIGWLAWFVTRYRFQHHPDIPPSPKPHMCSWCFGFCYTATALTLGGLLLGGALFTGEGCTFLRQDLFIWGGPTRYMTAFGLRPGQDDLAVDMLETCYTTNGTGDLLGTMGLREAFRFQPDLSGAFYQLDERYGEPPEGLGTRELLDSLKSLAAEYGDVFMLDPLPAVDNTTLGVLELNPNVADLLMGSSLFPNDMKGAGSFAPIMTGLNEYAALVAGPGKYTFSRGTAGGGFVITPDRPSAEELATLPDASRNALLYARAKERLLASNNTMNCDSLRLDAQGRGTSLENVTERNCSLPEFHAFIIAEAGRLEQALDALSAETAAVTHTLRMDMKLSVAPTLKKMRDMRLQLGCRFMWRRVEEFDEGLCDTLAPMATRGAMMMLGLAGFTFAGIIVQYKVWRHMKDNKILKYELERYEKKLAETEERIRRRKAQRAATERAVEAYQKEMVQLSFGTGMQWKPNKKRASDSQEMEEGYQGDH